jgi:hypothetical protein
MSEVEGESADDADAPERTAERTEIHFLAALTEELMRMLLMSGTLTQAQLNEIERSVARKIGNMPRAW